MGVELPKLVSGTTPRLMGFKAGDDQIVCPWCRIGCVVSDMLNGHEGSIPFTRSNFASPLISISSWLLPTGCVFLAPSAHGCRCSQHHNVFRTGLGVLDEDVEIPVVVEDKGSNRTTIAAGLFPGRGVSSQRWIPQHRSLCCFREVAPSVIPWSPSVIRNPAQFFRWLFCPSCRGGLFHPGLDG